MDAKRLKSFIIFFFVAVIAYGQHELQIDVSGAVRKKEFSKLHSSAQSAAAEANLILLDFQSRGYLQAHFDSAFADSTRSYYRVQAGPLYNWAELSAGNISTEVLDELRLRKIGQSQKPFSLDELSKLFQKLVYYYENIGHPFASIRLENLAVQNDSLLASLNLEPGPLVRYDSLVVKGYDKIGSALPRYEWRIRQGGIYRQMDFDQLPQRINSTPHLLASRDPIMLFTEEKNVLYVYIEKRKASQFDGIIGFASKPEGGVSLNGNVLLHLINSFNKGEEIRFHWTSPGNQSQTLNTFIRLPYIFKLPLTPEASFMLVKQDSTFLRLDYMAGLNFRLSSLVSFRFFYEGRSSSNINSATNTSLEYNSDFIGFGLDLMFLNDRYVPTIGFEANIDLLLGDREHAGENIYQWIYKLKAAYYFELFPRNVLKIGAQAANINNASLPNEYFRYGGLQTLRGFNEQQFLTPQYTSATVEYRFMLDPHSYLLAFSDASRLKLPENTDPITNLISFGTGLSLSTTSGVFNITYALGTNLGEGFNFSDSKIHFGYTNRF